MHSRYLSFDQRVNNICNAVNSRDVLLTGAGTTPLTTTPTRRPPSTRGFVVPLVESAGWTGEATGLPPTRAGFEAVPADITDFQIKGESISAPDFDVTPQLYNQSCKLFTK